MGGQRTTSLTRPTRYAPYIESKHIAFLDKVVEGRALVVDSSPYDGYVYASVDADFFGVGYLISSYPSLYDHFGKFMAGLDLEYLWNECMADILTPSEIASLVVEQVKELDEKVTQEIAAFSSQMRNINAVACSSFVIGAAKIEDRRVKDRASLSAQATFSLIPAAQTKWKDGINHNMGVVRDYARTMLTYYSSRVTTDKARFSLVVYDKLWPFTVLDFERAALGTMQTATFIKQSTVQERSKLDKFLLMATNAATGAQVGSQTGGWIGAIVGAVIGWQIGISQIMIEDGNSMWWYGWLDPAGGNIIAMTS